MNLEEFRPDLKRLAEGHGVTMPVGKIYAFYDRVGHWPLEVWTQAVTTMLCAPKFPANLDMMANALEVAQEHLRLKRVAQDRGSAQRWMAGELPPDDDSAENRAYRQFRLDLIRLSIAKGREVLIQTHCERLEVWLQDQAHSEWAVTQFLPYCKVMRESHHLYLCLVKHELPWWEIRRVRLEAGLLAFE